MTITTSTPTSPSAGTRGSRRTAPGSPRPRRAGRLPYGLMLPAALALGLALGYPLVRQVVLSFQEFGLAQQFGRPAEWVGIDNYRTLVTDAYLWKVVFRTVAFCLVNAALTMALGMGVALLMRLMSCLLYTSDAADE